MNVGVLQISVVFLVVGALLLTVVKSLKAVISSNGKKGFLYLLVTLLLFALLGVVSKESLFAGNLLVNYLLVQLLFLLLGAFHLLAMGVVLKWEEDKKHFSQNLFTLVAAVIGSIGFINAAAYFGAPGFHLFFLSGGLLFFVPLLFLRLWNSVASFPAPVYQKWYYPLSRSIVLPDSDELRNLRIVSLEFEKNSLGPKSIFKAKAPANMNFGKFFYHFINDYNYRTPEAPIAFKDPDNRAYGWYFYVKPNLIGLTRSVNPELTIHTNSIKEHATIVCQRVLETNPEPSLQSQE